MGDRGNIAILNGHGQLWFYTHWRGSDIEQVAKEAISLKQRWDDGPYLARIIWDKLVPSGKQDKTTGFGIDTRLGDNEYPIVVVDIPKKRVFLIEESALKNGTIPDNYEPPESKTFTEFMVGP